MLYVSFTRDHSTKRARGALCWVETGQRPGKIHNHLQVAVRPSDVLTKRKSAWAELSCANTPANWDYFSSVCTKWDGALLNLWRIFGHWYIALVHVDIAVFQNVQRGYKIILKTGKGWIDWSTERLIHRSVAWSLIPGTYGRTDAWRDGLEGVPVGKLIDLFGDWTIH